MTGRKGTEAAWAVGHEGEIKKLVDDGESYQDIGATFGASKSAVAGFVNRQGWAKPRRSARTAPTSAQPTGRRPPQNLAKIIAARQSQTMHTREPDPPPASRNLTIIELRNDECRYPTNEAFGEALRFCGKRAPWWPAVPYCGEHARIAYRGWPT